MIFIAFNEKINGFKNERNFKDYLNGRKIKELHPIFRDLFEELYGEIDENEQINCKLNPYKQKGDILIKVKGKTKRISIKKGVKNSVHIEPLTKFINFLKDNNVPEEIINEYVLFHYADGTNNNTGTHRQSSEEYKINNQDKLNLINEYFNTETLLNNAISRFVLKGNNSKYEVDALIYGVVNDFIWITSEEIKYIINSNKNITRTGVGFGSLFCQPMNRCINRNPIYENKRKYIQIKWYHLSDDIIETMITRKNVKLIKEIL